MNRSSVLATLLATAVLAAPATAQDNFPPDVEVVGWSTLNFATGQTTLVFSLDGAFGTLQDVRDYQHLELDIVFATVRLTDRDWDLARAEAETDETDPNPERPEYEEVYLGLRVFSTFAFFNFDTGEFELSELSPPFGGPVIPIFPGQLGQTVGPVPDVAFSPDENDFPFDTGRPYVDVVVAFQLPRLTGPRQSRLAQEAADPDFIGFDTRYLCEFIVSNEATEDVDELDDAISFVITIGVIVNPDLVPPNPPPFADGTSELVVESNTTVILDGRRSFDASNIGFDQFVPPDENNVYLRDILRFSWEWISGPERVDPVQASETDPEAEVTLVEPGTYRYRVIVSDQSGNPPSAAAVEITVVEAIADNTPPVIAVETPLETITVGDIITLDASLTSDADGDQLTFRWRQSNAFGEPLEPEALREAFQPLDGLVSSVSTWQAVSAGRFYFVLLVDDGTTTRSRLVSVDVEEPQTQGAVDEADGAPSGGNGNPGDDAGVGAPLIAPAACGAGLLPVAAVPFVLLAGRRRS